MLLGARISGQFAVDRQTFLCNYISLRTGPLVVKTGTVPQNARIIRHSNRLVLYYARGNFN
jgi:hypothetical protein